MDLTTILPYSIFVAVTAGFWTASNLLFRRTTRTSARLEALRNPLLRQRRDPVLSAARMNAMSTLVEKAAPALSRALEPKSESEQSLLRVRLANAGFSRPNAVRNFLAIKSLCLGLGVLAGFSWMSMRSGWANNGWMLPVVVGSVLFYAPEVILAIIRSGRQEKIFLQLPDALDLIIVCIEAGSGIDQALVKTSEELVIAYPALAEEVRGLATAAGRDASAPGAAVFAGMEGTRPVLVEIQALVAPTALGTPRHTTACSRPARRRIWGICATWPNMSGRYPTCIAPPKRAARAMPICRSRTMVSPETMYSSMRIAHGPTPSRPLEARLARFASVRPRRRVPLASSWMRPPPTPGGGKRSARRWAARFTCLCVVSARWPRSSTTGDGAA